MSHVLRSVTAPDPLQTAAAALVPALSCVPHETRDVAWQDGLDLLATIAGMKPVCLIGRGFADPAWHAALRRVADDTGLPALEAAPWFPAAEPGFLPDWYAAASARRNAAPVIYICRDDTTRERAAALSAEGRIAAADEAALLGYPLCCVAQHHERALGFERLAAAMLERLAGGDRARMERLAEAGVEPLPATDAEWQQYARLMAIHPSSGTSVNPCDACAADPASAAARLAQRYHRLAVAAGYPPRT